MENRSYQMSDGMIVKLIPSGKISEIVSKEDLPNGDTRTLVGHEEIFTAQVLDINGRLIDAHIFSLSLDGSMESNLRKEYSALGNNYY